MYNRVNLQYPDGRIHDVVFTRGVRLRDGRVLIFYDDITYNPPERMWTVLVNINGEWFKDTSTHNRDIEEFLQMQVGEITYNIASLIGNVSLIRSYIYKNFKKQNPGKTATKTIFKDPPTEPKQEPKQPFFWERKRKKTDEIKYQIRESEPMKDDGFYIWVLASDDKYPDILYVKETKTVNGEDQLLFSNLKFDDEQLYDRIRLRCSDNNIHPIGSQWSTILSGSENILQKWYMLLSGKPKDNINDSITIRPEKISAQGFKDILSLSVKLRDSQNAYLTGVLNGTLTGEIECSLTTKNQEHFQNM